MEGEFGFGRAATGEHLAVFERGTNDTEGILDRAFDLVDNVVGATANDQCDAFGVLDILDEEPLVAADVLLCDAAGEAEVVLGQVVEIGDDAAAGRTSEGFEIGVFRTAGGDDALLCEVVLGHVVDAVADKDNVDTGVGELVDHLFELFFFLIEELLQL